MVSMNYLIFTIFHIFRLLKDNIQLFCRKDRDYNYMTIQKKVQLTYFIASKSIFYPHRTLIISYPVIGIDN